MIAWRLAGRTALVVGGGQVATQRVRLAIEAGAKVRVVSPELTTELLHRAKAGQIEWRRRPFEDDDFENVDMALCAVDDAAVSARVFAEARKLRIPVNVADVPEQCDFWFTSVERRGPIQVAVSTNGHAPALGARIKREIAGWLSDHVSKAVCRFRHVREAVRRRDPSSSSSRRRMRWLTSLARDWSYEDIGHLEASEIEGLVDDYVDQAPPTPKSTTPRPRPLHRWVHIVGAGPGAADLLTVRGRNAIETAELVVCDQLVSEEIKALVTGQLKVARRRRGPGAAQVAQTEVELWVVEACRAGLRVVRLKIGDPLFYGRASEEVARYEAEGLKVMLTPGVTSVTAAGSDAFLSLTDRAIANRVLVMTGHGAHGRPVRPPAYEADTTVVVLMGVRRAEAIAAEMIAAGWPAATPAAIVERASMPEARTTRCTLDRLGPVVADSRIAAPAVIIIGGVARGMSGRTDQVIETSSHEVRVERALMSAR